MSFMNKINPGAILPFGLLGNALLKNKDKDKKAKPQATFVTEGQPPQQSMIGSGRNY